MFKLYCCGSRGSRPVEGRRFNEFGGFTSCYILKTYDYALIIDCGTGFYEANSIVCDCTNIDVVFTHVHYDHILGMLDWTAIPKTSNVTFYGNFDGWFGEDTMFEFFRKPFWPVQPNFKINQCPEDGIPLKLRKNLQVRFYDSPHPNGAKLMMIETNNSPDDENPIDLEVTDAKDIHKMAVMFDCEHADGLPEDMLNGIDFVVYDGMYTDEEYPTKVGFGHSTWQEGCKLATRVNCGKLIITHHSPDREDTDLRAFEQKAREIYPETDFARSGQSWDFPLFQNKQKKKGLKPVSLDELVNEEVSEAKADSFSTIQKNKIKRWYKDLGQILLDQNKLSYRMERIVYLTLAIVSFVMSFVNIFTDKRLLMWSTFIFAATSFICYLVVRLSKKTAKVVLTCFQVSFLALLTFFVVTGEPEGFAILWSLLLPSMGMLVFGRKRALLLSAIYFVILIFFFWTPIGKDILVQVSSTGTIPYNDSYLLRFPFAFVAFTVLGYLVEFIREYGYKKLTVLKTSQDDRIADQTSELREQNYELLRVNAQLGLRNRLLSKTFGRFMPDQVVEELLENSNTQDVEGKNVYVTMLQCDIRGFTKMTKNMEPLEAFEMLNNYFKEMTDIVQKFNGTILDYVGDAMLVVFGAPIATKNHTDDAIRAALEMQRAMRKVNSWNRAFGYEEIKIGIGINTGEVYIGTVGASTHMKYDAVGPTVNLCSRIESVCEGGKILVTDEVLKNINKSVKISGVKSENLKGFDQPISLFEIEE